MRLFLLFVCICIGPLSFAQSNDLIPLRGNISQVQYYQGGAALSDEYRMPKPYSTRIWVVEYIDSATVPKPVKEVQTDSLGNFTVYLPPGTYGFLTSEDLTNVRLGQILPTNYQKTEDYNSTSQYWTCSETLPLLLEKEKTISLTYYNVTVCMMCP